MQVRECTIDQGNAMCEYCSASAHTRLPSLNPEIRDSIRNRLRLCLICHALKQEFRPFHNAHPEPYERVHARHRLIQDQLARMRKVGRIVHTAQDRDGLCIWMAPWWPSHG